MNITKRRVVVEVEESFGSPIFFLMDEEGNVRTFTSKAEVTAHVKRQDRATVRRGADAVVTEIEWS